MKILTKYSPAELLLILEEGKASTGELLKVTFIDLLLKQVVRTYVSEKQITSRDTVKVKYVAKGENFSGYKLLPHEKVFLSPFKKSRSIQILFEHMVKMAFENAESPKRFRLTITQNQNLKNCFSQNIFQQLFGGVSLTAVGRELQKNIRQEITELEKTLLPAIAEGDPRAMDVMKEIKGNVFLLPNVNLESLKNLDKELLSEMNKREKDDKWGGLIGCSGCTWEGYKEYSDSFDNSCSSTGGEGSGCGASGCSGCGGCGGCGGS